MRMLTAAEGQVLGLGFSPAGDALAAAVEGRGVYLWNLASASALSAVARRIDGGATFQTRNLDFSPDGRFVSWLGPAGLRAYDRKARTVATVPLGAPGPLAGVSRTPDGSRLVTQHTSFREPALIGWRAEGDEWVREWSLSTESRTVHDQTVCPTGRRVALLSRPGRGRRWWDDPIRLELRSAVSGVVEATADYPYSYSVPLRFSPDGSQLVAVHGMTLLVWPVPELGEPRVVRNDTRKHFTAAAFHPSGRYLFATSNDTTAHVFETATWERVGRFTWKVGRLRGVAVSPDGTMAAAGGDRGEVVVWDVDV
jgi:WD40 repeat protein